MKIKLAILEKDQSYLNRIISVFNTKYADKFEIYSFTDVNIAMETLHTTRIDVFVASDAFDINVADIPSKCGFAYFVDSADVESVREQRTICRFQKVDLIYKQILSIYSESAGNVSVLKLGDENTKVIVFSSPDGGTGTSSMAAACATYLSSIDKKALYLNIERFGTADVFFSADGMFDISDIVFAIKSKKTNLAMKLESCVKQDKNGVFFYSGAKVALDVLELTTEDVIRLISELKLTGSYDYIVLDMDFHISKEFIKVYKQAVAVVWVGDGSDISNTKIQRAYNALSIMKESSEDSLVDRIRLIYNRFSNKTGKTVGDIGLKSIGGAPKYEYASTQQVVSQLASMDLFEQII
jgi:MinD-like ATPase involved in chromosome partitioning or flagellar assembly